MNKEQRKDDFNADFSKKTEAYRQQLLSRTNLTPQKLEKMLDDLIGTRGAYILDNNSNILGKVPTSELTTTIKDLNNGKS